MKIYLVKHKGKTWWGNFVMLANTMHIGKYSCNCLPTFFFKRDAQKYLETHTNKQFLEIVSAEVKQSKQDNRKRY